MKRTIDKGTLVMDVLSLSLLVTLAFSPIILGSVILVRRALKESRQEKAWSNALASHGISVTGQIVKHRVEEVISGCHYYLTYQCIFEEKEYIYEQQVSVEGFNALRDGESAGVLFLPQDPPTPELGPIDRLQLPL